MLTTVATVVHIDNRRVIESLGNGESVFSTQWLLEIKFKTYSWARIVAYHWVMSAALNHTLQSILPLEIPCLLRLIIS